MRAELDVFYESEIVGTLFDTHPLKFEYSANWLKRRFVFPIGGIELRPGPQEGAFVDAYFENLLPEGECRSYLVERYQTRSVFDLLSHVGGDTVGAFVLASKEAKRAEYCYAPFSWDSLALGLKSSSATSLQNSAGVARVCLSGAQDKGAVAILADGSPRWPLGTSPSTHILKPDIRRHAKVRESAANEALIMRTAKHCGFKTAEVFYEPSSGACMVKRFDRIVRPDGELARLEQFDFCQLAGVVSERKYEKDGGPGLHECAQILRRHSSNIEEDLRTLVLWTLFNIFVGNCDGHAKNLSMYKLPNTGLRLTPLYDLLCTRTYPGLSRDFAFNVGGEVRIGEMGGAQLDGMAKQVGYQGGMVSAMAMGLADRLPDALDRAFNEIKPDLSHSARTFCLYLTHSVKSQTKKAMQRFCRISGG